MYKGVIPYLIAWCRFGGGADGSANGSMVALYLI